MTDEPDLLVDTSAAIALIVSDHEGHAATISAASGKRLGLSGHAWFETYSVLTRLPPGVRRSPEEVARTLAHDFPQTRFLDGRSTNSLCDELASLGIAGGAVHDALVGATARRFRKPLMTRDRRAKGVYDALGVEVMMID